MKFYLSGGWDARGGKKGVGARERKTDGEETGAEGNERGMKNGRICPYDGARFAARGKILNQRSITTKLCD